MLCYAVRRWAVKRGCEGTLLGGADTDTEIDFRGMEQQQRRKSMPRVFERQRSAPVSPRFRTRKVVTWASDREIVPDGADSDKDRDETSDKENAKGPLLPRVIAIAANGKTPEASASDTDGIDVAVDDNLMDAGKVDFETSNGVRPDSVKGKLEVLHRAHVDALRHRLGVGMEAEALKRESQDLRDENCVLRKAKAALEKENAVLKKEFHAALRDNQAWCRESKVLQEEYTQAFLEKTTEVFEKTLALERDNEALRREIGILKKSLADSEAAKDAAEKENRAWQHENRVLHDEYKEHLAQSVEILRENTALKEQIAVSNDEYSRITASTRAYMERFKEKTEQASDVGRADREEATRKRRPPSSVFNSNRSVETLVGDWNGGAVDFASGGGKQSSLSSPRVGSATGGWEGGDKQGREKQESKQRQKKVSSVPSAVRIELSKRGSLETWVHGFKWIWNDEKDSKEGEKHKEKRDGKEATGVMEEKPMSSRTRNAAASAPSSPRRGVKTSAPRVPAGKQQRQQQRQWKQHKEEASQESQRKLDAWKSENERWLENAKTWRRTDRVLRRAESMPKDFWGAGGSRRGEEIKALALPKTLTMKLENRAFRSNYLETLRASQLSPRPAVDLDDFSEGSSDTDDGF